MATGDRLTDFPAEHGLETTWITARDGTRLRVLLGGEQSGPRLLCVHGFPQNAAEWRKVHALVRDRFAVSIVDLRGFGRSDLAASGDYTLETLTADLESVIDGTAGHGRGDRVHLLSHDWGGPISWSLCEKRPQLVAHHTAVNAPHFGAYTKELLGDSKQLRGGWYTLMFQIPGIERVLAANGAATFANGLRASSAAGTFSDEDIELYAGPLADPVRLGACLSYYRAAFRRLLRTRGRFVPPAEPIRVPSIVVWGLRDEAVRFAIAEAMKRLVCPDAEIRPIEGATHWVPDERPDLVARAVLDGLARTGGE